MLSTELLAWLRLHGNDCEQVLPEPLGEAYNVASTAASAAEVAIIGTAHPMVRVTATGASNRVYRVGRSLRSLDIRLPLFLLWLDLVGPRGP